MRVSNSLNSPAKHALQTEQLMHVGMVMASKYEVLAKQKKSLFPHIYAFLS